MASSRSDARDSVHVGVPPLSPAPLSPHGSSLQGVCISAELIREGCMVSAREESASTLRGTNRMLVGVVAVMEVMLCLREGEAEGEE